MCIFLSWSSRIAWPVTRNYVRATSLCLGLIGLGAGSLVASNLSQTMWSRSCQRVLNQHWVIVSPCLVCFVSQKLGADVDDVELKDAVNVVRTLRGSAWGWLRGKADKCQPFVFSVCYVHLSSQKLQSRHSSILFERRIEVLFGRASKSFIHMCDAQYSLP
jgi:hypothetical protein